MADIIKIEIIELAVDKNSSKPYMYTGRLISSKEQWSYSFFVSHTAQLFSIRPLSFIQNIFIFLTEWQYFKIQKGS